MNRKFTSHPRSAFTLVELLIVISIIAIIAALLMPVAGAIERKSLIQRATSEREQLETAISSYYGKYKFYPPSNTNALGNLSGALTNQLYYELIGNTSDSQGTSFTNLDDDSTNGIISSATAAQAFGVSGFMNCTKGNGEDSVPAQSFLPALKASQIAIITVGGNPVKLISSAVIGDQTYRPLPGVLTQAGYTANPWRYVYPGVNNPNSYDLWLQVEIGGKTNLICNWKDQPQINSSLP